MADLAADPPPGVLGEVAGYPSGTQTAIRFGPRLLQT